MTKLSVLDKTGKETTKIDLPKDIFEGYVNDSVVHQAIVMYRAGLRQGNASTKERADVSGGGKKPYRQKGTGRARAGSSRSPLWKGGGVTFGPQKRDFSYSVPKKVKRAALQETLKSKLKDNKLVCVDDLKDELKKTKEFALILKSLNLKGRILAVLDGSDPSIQRVSKNIRSFQLARSQDVTAYDLLKYKYLLVTKTALNGIVERLKK